MKDGETIVEVRVSPDGLCYAKRNDLVSAVLKLGVRRKGYKNLGQLTEWFCHQLTKYGLPPGDEAQTGKLEVSYDTGVMVELRYYYNKEDGLFYSIDDLRLLLNEISETEVLFGRLNGQDVETMSAFVLLRMFLDKIENSTWSHL